MVKYYSKHLKQKDLNILLKKKGPQKYKTVIKRTEILLYRRNLNKEIFYSRRKKITLITREDVLLEEEGMVCLQ